MDKAAYFIGGMIAVAFLRLIICDSCHTQQVQSDPNATTHWVEIQPNGDSHPYVYSPPEPQQEKKEAPREANFDLTVLNTHQPLVEIVNHMNIPVSVQGADGAMEIQPGGKFQFRPATRPCSPVCAFVLFTQNGSRAHIVFYTLDLRTGCTYYANQIDVDRRQCLLAISSAFR